MTRLAKNERIQRETIYDLFLKLLKSNITWTQELDRDRDLEYDRPILKFTK